MDKQQQQHALLRQALPFLLAAITLLGAAHGALPCHVSGYCSLGKTKPFMGEVDSGLGLRAALAARSYRREVILMATDAQHVLQALQAVSDLRRLGLEHVMMMSSSGPDCVRVAGAMPALGCVWLDFKLPAKGQERVMLVNAIPMWHNRYRILARASRLQYNVLLLDSDVILFDDPYKYFKAPPFSNFTIINQAEVLFQQEDYGVTMDPNGGLLYVQNARPDGPATWMLSEAVDRLLRWIDDGFNLTRNQHGIFTWCNYMDQDALRDALGSVLLGRVTFAATMKNCRTPEWLAEHGSENDDIIRNIDDAFPGLFRYDPVPLPTTMHRAAAEKAVHIKYFSMRMPRYTAWNDSFGPMLYPPRGRLSLEWQKQLRDDCERSSCPMWPDPEAEADAEAAAAIPTEQYLFAPPFLMLNWGARGRFGYWHRALTPHPQQVIGHLHYIPGADTDVSKAVAKMAVGRYDWALARRVLGRNIYFLHEGATSPVPGGAEDDLYLVTFDPTAVPMARTYHWKDYAQLLDSLASVAAVLNRIPVWPDVPCNASWIAEEGPEGASSLPLKLRREFIPYARPGRGMMCTFLPLVRKRCLTERRGMLGLEFAHYKQGRPAESWEPEAHNTIGRVARDVPPLAAGKPLSSRIYNVPHQQLDDNWNLRNTRELKVLYLASPINVVFAAGFDKASEALARLRSDCHALNEAAASEVFEDRPIVTQAQPQVGQRAAEIDPKGLLRLAQAVPGWTVPLPSPPPEH